MFDESSRIMILLLSVGLAVVPGACRGPEPADLVLLNGRIVTVDDTLGDAEALAIRKDRILAVGQKDKIAPLIGPETRVIDLGGSMAVPGLIEGHAHLTGIGEARMNLNLMNAKNWDEIIVMVGEAVARSEPGDWILGRGWHQEKWDSIPEPQIEGLPLHHSLSKVSSENPVLLEHASGHASYANSRAMEMAGITDRTADPPGGQIIRDEQGQPIGVFRETAQALIARVLDDERAQRTTRERVYELRKQVRLAAEECLAHGITSFQDAGSPVEVVDALKDLVDEDKLPLRLWVMLSEGNDRLRRIVTDYRIINYGDHRLTVRAIKRVMDGALGSHGAWLLEPYSDLPTSVGLNTTSVDAIAETAEIAVANDLQLCVHAIGDRANRETLDIFEKTFQNHDRSGLRWRIEHAQHLHPSDILRFGRLGVIASMQGVHCTSDGPWVPERLGDKRTREGAYAWQKLMQSGAVVTNGTDAPVESVSPIASFYASVSRRLKDGSVFVPEERMTRMEALKSYTIHAAYSAFEEDIKGSLTPGKLADITVLDRDILAIPEEDIPGTQVVYTIVGGRVEYSRQ